MDLDYRKIDVRDRRIVIFASEKMQKELQGGINWREVGKSALPLAVAAPFVGTGMLLGPIFGTAYVLHRLFRRSSPKCLPYLCFDVINARDQFRFPVNHPVDGGVYTCCDAEPDLYVPLASFHRYMYEAKMSAFQSLCANLGLKTCRVVYAEEDGRDITGSMSVGVPTQAGTATIGAEAGFKTSDSGKVSIFLQYPRPISPPTKFCSGWMNGEPTWQMMQTLRLERNLEHYTAEFDYSSDMGITANIAAKLGEIGLSIGGKYEEIKRRKWKFDVEFWT